MKKTMILIVLIAFTCISLKSQNDNTKVPNTWQAKISFSLPELNPEAIQYAFVDFDPTETFVKKFNLTFLEESLIGAKDESEKTNITNASIESGWDFLFYTIKGSDVFLLTNKGTLIMADVTAATKKWLISKTFYIGGKPYCFIVPLNTVDGAILECRLDKNNMVSLTEIFQNKIKTKK